MFGVPDAGLVTSAETMMAARLMVNAVNVPVIVDADTAYGNAVIATRTTRDLIQAGAAAMQIEDQVTPKRCGWVAGKELIPLDEAVGKLRAAADVRDALDPDFVIVARTDSRGAVGGGLDEAVRRGKAYAQAGADLVFVEGLQSPAELDTVIREIPGAHLNWSYDLGRRRAPAAGAPGAAVQRSPRAAGRRAIWDFVHDLRARGTEAHRALRDVAARASARLARGELRVPRLRGDPGVGGALPAEESGGTSTRARSDGSRPSSARRAAAPPGPEWSGARPPAVREGARDAIDL